MKITLTNKEYAVLTKIADKSKMDCWFFIKYSNSRGHYVYDIENNKSISMRSAVKQLIDGCIDLNIDCLTSEEKFTLIKLLGDLI